MNVSKFFKWCLCLQTGYLFITAVWPLVHIESFMAVTGYKTDVWLVKTVGALVLSIAFCLGISSFIFKSEYWPVVTLCILSSLAFACIDFYYALTDVIADIYLADGFLQIGFILGWCFFIYLYKQDPASAHFDSFEQ